MARKVAIVAKAGTSALAPWGDTGWEIWGMPWVFYPRVTHLFEVHEIAAYVNADFVGMYKEKAPSYYADLPTYCPKSRMSEFKNPVELPIEDIKGVCEQTFLENTICYQIGLAILEGVDELALYGVHMRGAEEYDHQRSFVMYALGVAEGKGIKVTISDGCPIFMSKYEMGRYGVSTATRDTSNMFGGTLISHIDARK